MKILILAIALVLFVEGIGPLFFPNRWQRMIRMVGRLDVDTLRQIGIGLVSAGLLLFYLTMI